MSARFLVGVVVVVLAVAVFLLAADASLQGVYVELREGQAAGGVERMRTVGDCGAWPWELSLARDGYTYRVMDNETARALATAERAHVWYVEHAGTCAGRMVSKAEVASSSRPVGEVGRVRFRAPCGPVPLPCGFCGAPRERRAGATPRERRPPFVMVRRVLLPACGACKAARGRRSGGGP